MNCAIFFDIMKEFRYQCEKDEADKSNKKIEKFMYNAKMYQ